MKTNQFLSPARTTFASVALGLLVTLVNAQPTAPMPAEIVKPAPTSMDMKQGTDMDMKPMMNEMHEKMMAMKPSGNADVDFAMMMKMHHQGAITMAEAQLKNGKDGQMRAMAKDIIRAQKKEMAVFDKFLAKKGESGMMMGGPAMQMNK